MDVTRVNKIRAGLDSSFPFQVAHINLDDETDPAAVLRKSQNAITIVSDKHSYAKRDRIFPINQDENSVFAQYVYRDCQKHNYRSVLDIGTGSGVLAMTAAKAGVKKVVAIDINSRAAKYVALNNEINDTRVEFVASNLFANIDHQFDKIIMDPPFMPSPKSRDYPLHAQSQTFGYEILIEPLFKKCWKFLNEKGTIQMITHSFGAGSKDSFLDVMKKYLPQGWSYSIQHVFPVKELPLELYTSHFVDFKGYAAWIKKIQNRGYATIRFFMITITLNNKKGLLKEQFSAPRSYNLIYPPTTLNYLSKHLKTKLLERPVSERQFPTIGHLMRLSRYNYFVYLTLCNFFSSR